MACRISVPSKWRPSNSSLARRFSRFDEGVRDRGLLRSSIPKRAFSTNLTPDPGLAVGCPAGGGEGDLSTGGKAR